MQTMITVEEADRLIRENVGVYPAVDVPFSDISGRVLRRDITADRDLPPYNRVTMDGIALAYAAWETGRRDFPIAGMVKAGEPPLELTEPTQCVEIMTGAVLPESCDCVVPVEDITITDGYGADGGGGIRNEGTVDLKSGATVTGNSASKGGGIENHKTLTMEGGSIENNTAAKQHPMSVHELRIRA